MYLEIYCLGSREISLQNIRGRVKGFCSQKALFILCEGKFQVMIRLLVISLCWESKNIVFNKG